MGFIELLTVASGLTDESVLVGEFVASFKYVVHVYPSRVYAWYTRDPIISAVPSSFALSFSLSLDAHSPLDPFARSFVDTENMKGITGSRHKVRPSTTRLDMSGKTGCSQLTPVNDLFRIV